MKFTKVLTAASESEGSDEDVREAVGPEGGVGEGVSWEGARRLNKFGHRSRMDCKLREGFVDMVEEIIVPCAALGCVVLRR